MEEYSFVIRRAQLSDAEDIRRILAASFVDYMRQSGIDRAPDGMLESVGDIERDIARHDVFIAVIDGSPVGSVRVSVSEDGETAMLSKLGVVPGSQNIGVGKSLVNMVDKVIEARRVKTLTLYTAAKNASIMRFYYGRGFYVDSTSKGRGYVRALMKKEYAC